MVFHYPLDGQRQVIVTLALAIARLSTEYMGA
jgi:hypothetical protein